MDMGASSSLPPLTALHGVGPVRPSVILLRHLVPIGGEDGAARCLVALHHGAASILIDNLIHLLEGVIYATLRLLLLLLSDDVGRQGIPVRLLLV